MGNDTQANHEVFISYSSKDKKWADAACAVLERHRIRCWVAPRDITPGTEWGAAIISGMDASKIMVLIFSTHANQSSQVRREVERAIGKGLIVLPFRVEDVKPAGAMEYALSNTHWLDGFTPPVERHLDFLARSVNSLLTNDRCETPETPDRPVITPVPTRPYGLLLIAGGLAVLTVMIVAGSLVMFRDRTAPPVADTAPVRHRTVPPVADTSALRRRTVPAVADTAPRSDQQRIQGRWQLVEWVISGKPVDLASSMTVWEFQGSQLTQRSSDSGSLGPFSLSAGVERKLFDFNGTTSDGKAFEFLGIYDFEGEFLKICWVRHYYPQDRNIKRPDSLTPGSGRVYARFRRLGHR